MAPGAMGYFGGNAELETDHEALAAIVEAAYCVVADIDAVNIKEACEGFGVSSQAIHQSLEQIESFF
jgi:predicted Zn-dependent protease